VSASALESPTSPRPSPPPGAEREQGGPEGLRREKPATADGAIHVSASTGDGVPELTTALAARIAATYDIAAPLLTRARHREALETAADALRRSLSADLPELRAEDLRLAWRSLGRITGRVDVEDLLDVIFADFCLGK
jgi:tRNA modification GTPase